MRETECLSKHPKIVLDVSYCSEENDGALRQLKSGKSAGHDLVQPEHLKHGYEVLKSGSNKSAMLLYNLKAFLTH